MMRLDLIKGPTSLPAKKLNDRSCLQRNGSQGVCLPRRSTDLKSEGRRALLNETNLYTEWIALIVFHSMIQSSYLYVRHFQSNYQQLFPSGSHIGGAAAGGEEKHHQETHLTNRFFPQWRPAAREGKARTVVSFSGRDLYADFRAMSISVATLLQFAIDQQHQRVYTLVTRQVSNHQSPCPDLSSMAERLPIFTAGRQVYACEKGRRVLVYPPSKQPASQSRL